MSGAKVRLLVNRAGRDFVQNAGDEVEVSEDEAERLVEAQQAELLEGRRSRGKSHEKATREQRETTDLPPAEERTTAPENPSSDEGTEDDQAQGDSE